MGYLGVQKFRRTRKLSLSNSLLIPFAGKGQNEGGFSDEQIQMYKDCFKLMDINKDGQLDKNDLRGAFDNVGVLMTEGELDSLLGEVGVIIIILISLINIIIIISL